MAIACINAAENELINSNELINGSQIFIITNDIYCNYKCIMLNSLIKLQSFPNDE
jgi:hypothetical protein